MRACKKSESGLDFDQKRFSLKKVLAVQGNAR